MFQIRYIGIVSSFEDCTVHLNHVSLIGRLSKRPELRHSDTGVPYCSLVVACEEVGPGAKVFTTWIPVDITGKFAEQTSVDLQEGDELQITGKLKYKSVVDKQTQQKVSKLIVSTWGIQQRSPSDASIGEGAVSLEGSPEIVAPRGDGAAALPKKGKPRYPKWKPDASHRN